MKKNCQGQAMLVLIIITMIAAITIGASIAARSIISNRQTTFNIQNESAFTLADSGVEIAIKNINDALSLNQPIPTGEFTGTLDSNTYKYEIAKEGDTTAVLNMPSFSLNKNQIEVFLLNKKISQFTIKWAYKTAQPVPMEINYLRKEPTTEYTLVQKSYYCPDNTGTPNLDNLLTPSVDTATTTCTVTENVGNPGSEFDLVQIVPRVNNTSKVEITITPLSGEAVPLQGYTITSSGTSGQSQRSIKVLYMLPTLARIFNNTLYAQSIQNN